MIKKIFKAIRNLWKPTKCTLTVARSFHPFAPELTFEETLQQAFGVTTLEEAHRIAEESRTQECIVTETFVILPNTVFYIPENRTIH
jgi:hypothetical protein